jgi:hypothetical protein
VTRERFHVFAEHCNGSKDMQQHVCLFPEDLELMKVTMPCAMPRQLPQAVSWESSTGNVVLYDNGRPVWRVRRAAGRSIPSGGTLVIGREQVSK